MPDLFELFNDQAKAIRLALATTMTITLNLDASTTDSHTRRTLTEISMAVAKSKKAVVITGAGISCSSGIPDFRSSDGLYALVKQQYPDVILKGRDLFDASLFRDATSTAVFYTFISQLKRSIDRATPTPTHHFIKILDNKKKLLRSYTQNIDGLEARVGLLGTSCQAAKSAGKGKQKIKTKDVRNVQLHGDIHLVRCMSCSAEYPCTEEHLDMFNAGTPPGCPECLKRSEARTARSARPLRVGSLRPAIVLYDEPHPLGDEIGAIHTADVSRKPDLLIVMGTSLKVHGLKKIVKDFARTVKASRAGTTSTTKKHTRTIFINKTAPGAEWADIFDYHIAGETDAWSSRVIEDWKKMRPMDWETQQTLVSANGNISMSSSFKVTKIVNSLQKKGTKKTYEENIAPTVESIAAMDISSPINQRCETPHSPGKRRQRASHYNSNESSPSKRRIADALVDAMPAEERKVLFAESINILATTSKVTRSVTKGEPDMFDLSMQDVEAVVKEMVSGTLQDTKLVPPKGKDSGLRAGKANLRPLPQRSKTRSASMRQIKKG